MCLLEHMNSDIQKWYPEGTHRVTPGLEQEAGLLTAFAPSLRTNVRAPVSNDLYCLDASLYKGSICKTTIPSVVAKQIHYWSDVRGGRTFLAHHTTALKEKQHGKERMIGSTS